MLGPEQGRSTEERAQALGQGRRLGAQALERGRIWAPGRSVRERGQGQGRRQP